MAGQFVGLVFDAVCADVEPSEKLVLLALADCANSRHHGRAYPSNAELARRTCLSGRQVRCWLRSLEQKNLVKGIAYRSGGRAKATVYRLNVEGMIFRLAAVDRKKAEAHGRVLDKLPGTLSPPFWHEFRTYLEQNPEAGKQNPEVSRQNPEVQRTETRKPTSPQQEVEPEFKEQEVEPEGAARASRVSGAEGQGQTRLIETKSETPKPLKAHMTRDEQVAAARAGATAEQTLEAAKRIYRQREADRLRNG